MNRIVAALAVLVLAAGLSACDDDRESPPGPSVHPIRFDQVNAPGKKPGGCLSAAYLGRYVEADLFHVSAPTTIASFEPEGTAPGLRVTAIRYARYPKRVDGHLNTDGGGTYYLEKPLPKHTLLDLDRSVGQPIAGAELTPGDYVVFIHMLGTAAGGKVTSWRIERTGATPGTTTWPLTLRLARRCA